MKTDMMTENEARELAEKHLDNVVDSMKDVPIAEGVTQYSGKVRENYIIGGKSPTRVMLTTDRVSVFDQVVGTIPFKGQVLDDITHWWFDRTEATVPNHVIERPAKTITVAEQCSPLKVEIVVRAYLTGTSSTSIWTAYERGEPRFCGYELPQGMKKDQKLPYLMITPSTKAEKGEHDISIDHDAAKALLPGTDTERGLLWQQVQSISLALFLRGEALAKDMGLILVDTKYEMGIDPQGRLVLIDEIHTPDSSRFWEADMYEPCFAAGEDPIPLSKQFVRDAVITKGYDPRKGGKIPMLDNSDRVNCAALYIMLCQRMTGRPFTPDVRINEERVYAPLKNLGVLR
jgi:phosphoribosylaminoimidazole-succinocarboxamide synthase